jgi:hypothetical protein
MPMHFIISDCCTDVCAITRERAGSKINHITYEMRYRSISFVRQTRFVLSTHLIAFRGAVDATGNRAVAWSREQ